MVFGRMFKKIRDFLNRSISFGLQDVRFSASLCDSGYSTERYLLKLRCFPCHINRGERKEEPPKHREISFDECSSDVPLKRGDRVFFCLSDAYTLVGEGNAYLTYVLIQLKVIIENSENCYINDFTSYELRIEFLSLDSSTETRNQ